MFGIGGGELLLIAFVALIVFGPQRIPEVAQRAARAYREFMRLRRQVDSTLDDVKHDLQLDKELKSIGMDEPVGGAPQLRIPGEARSASASTLPKAEPGGGNGRSVFQELPVPAEDDYLGEGTEVAADSEPKQTGGRV